jgi:methylenetetrahydrofolate dehydrogenase (NADP+)/methenyltetrahydrofolate cyclohydrolase/formyltetrahydrofolate synthetase
MQKLDPTKMKDWEIAEAAESHMKTVYQLAEEMGLDKMELLPYGHYVGKIDYMSILERLKDKKDAKYIEVTAITPTPLGEGKTTTSMGLVEGLGKLGKKVMGAIRQPSGGPTFNIKGSAAGGGLAQCIPLTDFSLGLTGDIDAVTNAHNLAMVALTSRLQHEFNYDDEALKEKRLKRLDIDPRNVAMGLLRPGPARDHYRHRRQDGRPYDEKRFPDHRFLRNHGHSRRHEGPGGHA